MGKSAEELEWEKATEIGRTRTFMRAFPLVAGVIAGTISALVIFFFLMNLAATRDRVTHVTYADGTYQEVQRESTPTPVRSALFAIVIPSGIGFAAFLGVFLMLGGKLSPEHRRALRG